MVTVSGYKISEKLSESANSYVYRGLWQANNQPVVLKILKEMYPPPEKIAWFKREYEVTRSINLAGVVEAYRLESQDNRWMMVLEDFGGESLQRLKLAGKLAWPDFLKLALEITTILGQIHQQHIIHKDINPSNIVVNPASGQVKIIDFGISTVLSRENATFRNPNVVEGTLAYISPEQTGRMNRAIDYRTDFYSLGVTFYELLTGQLPFPTQDALELVHCHIARQPAPPHEYKPEIPPLVSEMVLKLMQKNAEDRYQSAYGLKADLEACLRQWQAHGQVEPFRLGQHDVSDRFQIPQKLYGREREIETLLATFTEVSQGTSKMMLVSGYAGIGKSALIQEIYKPITYRRGYFISGKFDQLQHNIPYDAFIQAFRSLMRQLLTENELEIAAWREKLLAALGANGQVIVEVIPEVELIIGPQPELPDLPPTEAQNRFNLVFQNFMGVFTQPEHPLVMFLDDLQWADAASLQLLKLLLTVSGSQYLFVIGAYRANEVSAAHPLMLTLDEIRQVGDRVNEIALGPLDLPHVNQFMADALYCAPETAQPLAELILAKTNGNPFFIIEFLKSLYTEALLTFDFQQGSWRWDWGRIQAQDMTDNVVELMAGKVRKLRAETQQVLKLAACIGNQFDLQTVAIVYEKSPRETALDLWEAIAEGLVLPLTDAYKLIEFDVPGLTDEVKVEYKFAHDRIQQAIYSLIPEADKQTVHWQVGQLLLQASRTSPEEQEQKLFDIVNQLNLGRALIINEQVERNKLAQLNLWAGQKAKTSAAYQPAFNYLRTGLELLAEDSWESEYDLTLGLYVEGAEAALLTKEFAEMERLVEVVLERARTVLDKEIIYEVRIKANFIQLKFLEAVQTALEFLRLLDLTFPEEPGPDDIMLALQETQSVLAERRIEDLINLPKMTDPAILAAMRVITSVWTAVYIVKHQLLPLLICKQVNLSVEYGNAADSAQAYTNYGLVLVSGGNLDVGYQFGQLALKVLEQFNAKEHQAGTYLIVHGFLSHWKEPLRDLLPFFVEAYQSGLETGEFEFAANAATTYCITSYLAGKELVELEREMTRYGEALTQLKQEAILHWHKTYWQGVLNLLGRSEDPRRLRGEVYDEEKMLPLHLEANDKAALFNLYFNKTILAYLFQEFRQAVEYLDIGEEYFLQLTASFYAPPHHFYDSLARLALWPETSPSEQECLLERVAANQEKMKTWLEHAPMNCAHKFYLVEAEQARVLGHDREARDYYDQAIELAHQHEYLNEEALAYELAARFYLERGQTRLARYYLRDAHYAYRRWGATAKVKDLEARYSQFLASTRSSRELPTLTTPTTDSAETASSLLDLTSVLKASQAISGEIELDRLLATLMRIVIENAGAQRGYLILERQGCWMIEAEAEVSRSIAASGDARRDEAEAEIKALHSLPLETSDALAVSIINYVARTKEQVVLNDASQEGLFTQDPYIVQNQPKSILCLPLINQGKLNGLLYLENKLTTGAFTPHRQEVLSLLSGQAAISIENARLYARQVELTQSASRFVPQEFLQFLGKDSIRQVKLGDQAQQDMTILVSDIRSFTTLSETMTPQENFDFVNAYLGWVSPVIRQHHGFIAKYMGDGMMAVFPRRVEDALDAAIAQLKEVARYNVERQRQGQPPLQIGIGIHTGPVMLGTVGEAQRMQLDLLSDAVNVTVRLEGLSKLYGVALVISAETLMRLNDPTQYQVRFLGKTPVKGRQETLSVFEIFDGDPAEIVALKMQTKSDFEKALSLYYDWNFAEAKALFEQALQRYPGDKAARFYLKQMGQFTDYRLFFEEINTERLVDK